MVEKVLHRARLAADHAAGPDLEPLAPGRTSKQREVSHVGLGRHAEVFAGRWLAVEREDLNRRPGEPQAHAIADPHRGRPFDRGVVEERLVVPAQVDEDEPVGRRVDLGVEPGDLGERDRIDGDLAVGVPPHSEPLAGRLDLLRFNPHPRLRHQFTFSLKRCSPT